MFKPIYTTDLINDSILQSQINAEGHTDFLDDDETEAEYNTRMLNEGFAEINNGKVTIFDDGR